MNRKFIILVMITSIILFAFVISGLVAGPVFVKWNEKDEHTFTEWNYCTGEDVYFETIWHISGRIFTDSKGNYHYKDHINIHGVGVGAVTFTEYIGNGTCNIEKNGEFLGYPYEATGTATIVCISQGKGPNFTLHVTYHRTINANGETTVFFEKAKIECRGEKP